jgi:hypothetical protein
LSLVTDPRPAVLHKSLSDLLPAGWREAAPWGYPDQVELALVAGVFRAQTPEATAGGAVDVFMRSRSHSMLDDLAELTESGVAGVVESLGPRWGDTNVLGVPVLRANVIHDAAQVLVGMGIRSGHDLRAAALERPDAVETAVLGVRGLGSITWDWIALLAQVQVPPDRAVVTFVGTLAGDESLTPEETTELLRLTARRFASEERSLTHAVRELVRARAA